MALSEGARAGTRTRLSSAGPPTTVFAHALVWLLHAGEMPPVEKKAEEMHVLGAPGTPAPAHAERNRPTPQARMPHELSPADSLVPMVTQRSDVPHLTTAHAGRALLCVCAASARLGIFGELGDPSRGSVTPASETRPAGRLAVCRAERIRRRLGLRRSMLVAVVAHHDAAPMKRLGMSSSSHMDVGGASADSTRETSAVVGLHPAWAPPLRPLCG